MNKGGRPAKGHTPASVARVDTVNGWLPTGVVEDDTNREVCFQLRTMWRRLTERQQRIVILFEDTPDLNAIAKSCGFSGNVAQQKVEAEIKLPIVQKILRLRTTLIGGTLPTAMARRVLAQIILGTHDTNVTATQIIQAVKLNAMLQGELVPEVDEKDLPAGATNDATREESDRIMSGVLGASNAADLLKQRSREAQRERKRASEISMEAKPAPAPVSELSVAERIKASRG